MITTSEPDERVGGRVDVAGFAPVRPVVTSHDRVDAEPRIHGAAVVVYVSRDRVPAADDRCAGARVVPADGVRVPGEATDQVRGAADVGVDVLSQRSRRRRD